MNKERLDAVVRRIVASVQDDVDLETLGKALLHYSRGASDEKRSMLSQGTRNPAALHSAPQVASGRGREPRARRLSLVKRDVACLESVHSRLLSLYAQGHDTQRITRIINHEQNLYASVEQVTATLAQLNKGEQGWRTLVLAPVYLNMYVGFRDVRVQVGDAVVNRRAFFALGVDLRGYRSLLGVWLSETDDPDFLQILASDLASRGVKDILLLLQGVDGACGNGFRKVFPAVRLQMHLRDVLRRSMQYIPQRDSRALELALKPLMQAEGEYGASQILAQSQASWAERYPYVFSYWKQHWSLCCWQFNCSAALRRVMHMDSSLRHLGRSVSLLDRYPQPFINEEIAEHSIYMLLADSPIAWHKPVVNWRVLLNAFLQDEGKRLQDYL